MTPIFLTKNLNFRQKYSSLTPFLSQFVLFLTRTHNSTSQNIGGTDAWAVLHLKFWGDRSLSPPKSPPSSLPIQVVNMICSLCTANDFVKKNSSHRTSSTSFH